MKKFLLILTFSLYNYICFSQTDPKPNIVLIIADDMGWNQVSSSILTNNNPSDFYETPVIDQLASEGIAFTNGYVNGANCAPTRAAILSGQYAARPHNNIFTVDQNGKGLNRGNTNEILIGPDMGLDENNLDELPSSAITIAESLKLAGYTTAHFGKYHVGEYEITNTNNNAPTDQGFDYNFGGGTDGGPGNANNGAGYFAYEVADDTFEFGDQIGPELDGVFAEPYNSDDLALIDPNTGSPYASINNTDKHVTDAMVEAAVDFMDNNSNNPFFMHFSNFAIHGPFQTTDARPDYREKYIAKASGFTGLYDHESTPGQAALAEHMDQAIGRLVDYLKTTDDPRNPGSKLSENTIVYFVSDNGDAVKRGTVTQGQSPLKGMKGEYYEGGIRTVTFAWSDPTNGLLRNSGNTGEVENTPVVAFDLYPTFIEAAGGTLPSNYDIDGVSQWQMLTNGTDITRESLFWHHPGYLLDSKRDSRPVTVVRKGDYKLMHFYEDASYELYNLTIDLNENTNLLINDDADYVTIANDMIDDMRTHLISTNAPLPTFRSDGSTVPLPARITECVSYSNSLNATWNFEGDANDDSGNNNDPVNVSSGVDYSLIDFVEGSQSIVFDGSGGIEYSDSSASNTTFLRDEFSAKSVSVWIKPSLLGGVQNIFEEGGASKGIALRLNGSNLELTVRANNTSGFATVNYSGFPEDDDWHHVAFVYDGSNTILSLYFDGINVATSNSAPTSVGNHGGSGIGAKIGNADSFGNTESNCFVGKMDAFAVYEDFVLTGTQIASLANRWYIDNDNDSFGDSSLNFITQCSPPVGYVLNKKDCDDTDNTIYPGAMELANGVDNNCNGSVDERITYTYNESWSPTNPNGFTTDASIVIESGHAFITTNTTCNSLIVSPNAGLTINTGVTLTLQDAIDGLTLESTSSIYSSLILDGTITGTINYERHVNAYTNDGTTNDNDLITPPLNNQSLNDFVVNNSGKLLTQGASPVIYALAPYNNNTGSYDNYTSAISTTLLSGNGYRMASSSLDTNLKFTGDALNGSQNIEVPVGTSSSWNLIGNPYPSYIDFDTFHAQLISDGVLETGYVAVYGFDGDASDGWTVWDGNNGNLIAPGQAFFVKTKLALNGADPAPSVTFEPSMRRVGSSDDFIAGRNETSFSAILKLNSNEGDFNTNLYFRSNTTSGLDYGYDTAVFDSDNYDIFTKVVEGDSSLKLYNQALSFSDVYDVVVPLGINAVNGQSIVISLDETSNLPDNIYVYLEDTIKNTFTDLNTGNYASYIDNSITGLGRYFLHFQTNTLSNSDALLNRINVYCISKSKLLVIEGVLDNKTDLSIYDLQGRIVLNKELNTSITYNEIDVNFLKQGVYIVKVNNGEYSKIKKVIIN